MIQSYKMIRKSFLMVFILSLMQSAFAVPPNQPFVKVGPVKTLAKTDNQCTVVYKKHRIFVADFSGGMYQYKYFMNLNGKDVKLTSQPKSLEKFKSGKVFIFINWGRPSNGQMGMMDGDIFKDVKVRFTQGKQSFVLKATGGCDGGADYGL